VLQRGRRSAFAWCFITNLRTFADTTGTLLYRLKQPLDLVLLVLTLLAYGCPTPALIAAFGLDERTIAQWQRKAGQRGAKLSEPLGQPAALEAGVASQQHTPAGVDIVEQLHAQTFQGGVPPAHRFSRWFLSRRVSMACQKPRGLPSR